MTTGGHKIHVAADTGLGGMEIAQIVGAVDDPEVFVARGEIKNLLVGRKNNEGRKADLGMDRNDLCLRILHDPRGVFGVNDGEGTNRNEQAESAAHESFHN